MSKKINYWLDTGDIKNLNINEIELIIRGADSIISRGGRGLLAKILKGSKDKAIFEYNLDKIPVYSCFNDQTLTKITCKIDWLIKNDYLMIEHDYRLPLIYHTDKGWAIAKKIRIKEFLKHFDNMADSGAKYFNMSYLKDRNRELILEFLEAVRETGNKKYIPILNAWEKIEVIKVCSRIRHVILALKNS